MNDTQTELARRAGAIGTWAPSIAHICCRRQVAKAFGISEQELISRSRKHPLAQARQAAMYVLRKRFPLSAPCIARCVGVKDHSTVLHGIKAVEARMVADRGLAMRIKALIDERVPADADAHVRARHAAWDALKQKRLEANLQHQARAFESLDSLQMARRVKPKNDLANDDFDAARRAAGTQRLSEAMAAAGGWR